MAGYLGYLCFQPIAVAGLRPAGPDLALVGHGRFLVVEVKHKPLGIRRATTVA